MKANQDKLNQMTFINKLSTLPERQLKWLIGTWAFVFRLFVYPLIDPTLFDCLFSDIPSRPATYPQVTVSLILIQDMFNKTDDEMHDWMMSGAVDIRFATNTLGIETEKIPTSDKALTDFRNRCRNYAETHEGKNPLDECLKNTEFAICAMMGIDLSNVRMDSTQVSANMARMSRERIVYTENRRMLEYIAGQEKPEQLSAIEEMGLHHYLEDFDVNKVLYHASISSDKKRKKLADEADMILKICTEADLESTEGKLFKRVLSEQTVVEKGKRRFAVPEDHTMSSSCVQNPVDPDATYREKAGKAFIGYVTNIAEAVGPLGSQIVSWDLQQNVVNDAEMAKNFLQCAMAITDGIASYNKLLGIENPADMEKCRAVLNEKMELVQNTMLEAARANRRIPRAADLDPLHEETVRSTQMDMFEYFDSLGVCVQNGTGNASEAVSTAVNGNASVRTLSERILDSVDNTPLTFNEPVTPESADEEKKDDSTASAGEESGEDTADKETSSEQETEESSDNAPKGILVSDGDNFTINGVPGEEVLKTPEFAELPDDIRRQAILLTIRKRQGLTIADLKDTNIVTTDGAYSDEALAQLAAKAGFTFLPTDLFGKNCNPIIGLFHMDEGHKNVVSCPMGYPCTCTTYKTGQVRVTMEGNHCQHCPFRNDCKAKYQPRKGTYTFNLSPNSYSRIHTEAFIGSEQYKAVGRFRNGVETIPAMLHNVFHIDDMPTGRAVKKERLGLKMIACNIKKFVSYAFDDSKIAENPILARSMATT